MKYGKYRIFYIFCLILSNVIFLSCGKNKKNSSLPIVFEEYYLPDHVIVKNTIEEYFPKKENIILEGEYVSGCKNIRNGEVWELSNHKKNKRKVLKIVKGDMDCKIKITNICNLTEENKLFSCYEI